MKRAVRNTVVTAVTGGLVAAMATSAFGAITGSGASFPNVAYRAWCADSKLCSYTSKGSTGGITDFVNGVVDFAGSDALLTDQQKADLASKRGGATVKYFPTLLGAVTIPTNVEGVAGRLRLDGKSIAKIFIGEITKWNDPLLTAQNKGTTLPDKPITVCVRSDGSGTSFIFTTYLNNVYAGTKAKTTVSQQPNWVPPTLIKSPQNAGVANCVKQNSNSIGYVDLGDSLNAGLGPKVSAVGRATLKIIKRKGKKPVRKAVVTYVIPDTTTISKAATNDKAFKADLTADLTNSSIVGAYPIVGTTYLLGYSSFASAGRAGGLAEFKQTLDYFYSAAAQDKLASLGYAPVPANLITKAKAQLATVS